MEKNYKEMAVEALKICFSSENHFSITSKGSRQEWRGIILLLCMYVYVCTYMYARIVCYVFVCM